MNNDRELIHATMQWHAIYARRTELNAQRLAMEKEIWPKVGRSLGCGHPKWRLLGATKDEIVKMKAKERIALRALAKVCAAQRSAYGAAEIIDVIDGVLTLEMAA